MRARLIPFVAAGLFLIGCSDSTTEPLVDEDISSIQEALNQDDSGGFNTADEAPRFGLADLDDSAIDLSAFTVPELPGDMDNVSEEIGSLSNSGATPNQPPIWNACPHGIMNGVWRHVAKGFGYFHGKWASANGKVAGHLKGIYGKNKLGVQVFFGKYISLDGKFKGLLKGLYGKGFYKGRYFDKNGLKGILWGAYGKAKCDSTDGNVKCFPGAGFFAGKWRSLCEPPPGACHNNKECKPGDYCRFLDGACVKSDAQIGASTPGTSTDAANAPKPDDASPNDASNAPLLTGKCVPRPQACYELYAPVCGCDGKTYGNDCKAAAAGVSIAHKGECKLPPPPPPPCGSNADCKPGAFCYLPDGACTKAYASGAPMIAGKCLPRPQACYDLWAPVCGCNNKTYGNDCEAHAAGVSIAYQGECKYAIPCKAATDCPNGMFCDFCPLVDSTSGQPCDASLSDCPSVCGPPVCRPLKPEPCVKPNAKTMCASLTSAGLLCPNGFTPAPWAGVCADGAGCCAPLPPPPPPCDATSSDGTNCIPPPPPTCDSTTGTNCLCAPMDAKGVGLCDMHMGYKWDGKACVGVSGCSCEGTACKALYQDKQVCVKEHSSCVNSATDPTLP